jgi:voltage-gated potassium channel
MGDRGLARRILLIGALLFGPLLLGTVGFRVAEHETWFDAFYRTLTTITTVGDNSLRPLTVAGRVFNAVLILFGVTAIFLALGAMTQTIIELQLEDRFGERRRRRMIESLHGHFIICGYGRVGRNASLEFQRTGARFLVLDRNEQRIAKAAESGVLGLAADATQDESLRRAGIVRARGLIAALPSDAENLFVILSAKALNPTLKVVTRASEEEAGEKLQRAGADRVLTPYSMAGRHLADVLLRPHVVEFVDFARSYMGPGITIEQVQVGANAGARARSLKQILGEERPGLIVLGIHTALGETVFNPPSDAVVAAGDTLIVMGERSRLSGFEQMLAE